MNKKIRLGNVALKIGSGQTPTGGSAVYQDTGIPLIRSQNVLMTAFSADGLAYISEQQDQQMAGSRVCPNDVLLNITGASIGRVCIAPPKICPANVNQHVCIVRCGDDIDPHYLMFLLASPTFQDFIWEIQAGGTRQALTKQIVEDFLIPEVSIQEQRRIAQELKAQLAVVEEARRAAQAQVDALLELKAAAIEDTLSSVTTTCRIGDVARLQSGYAFKSAEFQRSGIRLLRNTNILPGKVYWDDAVFLAAESRPRHLAYELKESDILISLDRPIISTGIKVARVTAADLPVLLVQRVGRFILDTLRVAPDFLHAYLQSARFMEAISGHDQSVGVPHISPSQVEDVLFPCPELREQERLAGKLQDIMETTAAGVRAAQAQLDEIARLPSRLLAQAFAQG